MVEVDHETHPNHSPPKAQGLDARRRSAGMDGQIAGAPGSTPGTSRSSRAGTLAKYPMDSGVNSMKA